MLAQRYRCLSAPAAWADLLLDPGKYRAVAKKTTLSTGGVCLKPISPVAKK